MLIKISLYRKKKKSVSVVVETSKRQKKNTYFKFRYGKWGKSKDNPDSVGIQNSLKFIKNAFSTRKKILLL